jgi:hypothetical protein
VILAFDNGEPDIWFYLTPANYNKKKMGGTSSEGKSRVELALEGVYGCGCGQNFAPQYPPVI